MHRRGFMQWGSLCTLAVTTGAEGGSRFEQRFMQIAESLDAVLSHMFPADNEIPSAKEVALIRFVYETISDKSYDREIADFVLLGAESLQRRAGRPLLAMRSDEIEKLLRDYESDHRGKMWLSRMQILGLEGIFGDPIYGANPQMIGWRKVDSYGGTPRPIGRYLDGV